MVERWTRERRSERTRSLLLDAAEEVFARKGFDAASLDDIAETAGYTRGALYVHFRTKEDVFLAVSDRYWRNYFDIFADALITVTEPGEHELTAVADRWRQLSDEGGKQLAVIGQEFILYVLRNPDVRARVLESYRQVVESLSAFVAQEVQRLGGTLQIPAEEFAQLIIATSGTVTLSSVLYDVDLYRPAVQMYAAVCAPV